MAARPLSSKVTRDVELAGIEPASSDVDSGILRAQSAVASSQPRRSYGHVADGLSRC